MRVTISSLAGAILAAGAIWLAAPAQAQISVTFNNTTPMVTSYGTTNVIQVERGTQSSTTPYATMLTTLGVSITVDSGYEFQGFTALTLPSNDTGDVLSNADVTQSAAFSSAVNSANNNPGTQFRYDGALLDFQVRSSLPTGLYYKYALSDPTQFMRSFVRFQARNTSTGELATQTMYYGVNVNSAGTLAAAPEPGSIALFVGTLPLVGVLARRRNKR